MHNGPKLSPKIIREHQSSWNAACCKKRRCSYPGRVFGASLTEQEVNWLIEKEYAHTADDIIWRRSKLGLRLTSAEINTLNKWMENI